MSKLVFAPLLTFSLLAIPAIDASGGCFKKWRGGGNGGHNHCGASYNHCGSSYGARMPATGVRMQSYPQYGGGGYQSGDCCGAVQAQGVPSTVQSGGPVTAQQAVPQSGARRFSYDPTEGPVTGAPVTEAPVMQAPVTRPASRPAIRAGGRTSPTPPPQVRLRPGSGR